MVSTVDYSQKDKKYFNQYTHGYSPYTESDMNTLLRPLESIIDNLSRVRICEIGCASGQFSQALSERTEITHIEFIGLDIALSVLKRYPYDKVCCSAFEIPLKDESVDIVCLPAALHHLFPLDVTLAEISRILNTGGYIYCIEPNFFHPQRRFFMRFQPLYNLYRKANDVPINPIELKEKLLLLNFSNVITSYININFRNPSILQMLQNKFIENVQLTKFNKYIYPWFAMTAQKDKM